MWLGNWFSFLLPSLEVIPEGQLFNVMEDPGKKMNLWAEHPEVVERLMSRLNEWEEDGRS